MKQIPTREAVGHVICHDITRIIRGVTKEAAFRKGHIVTAGDIPVLLSLGKDNLYVWEAVPGTLHENEAAEILYGLCAGEGMRRSEIKEGKIEVIADCDGLLTVDRERLRRINSLGEMMIATRHGYYPVHSGDRLAGARVIPLVISEEKMEAAKSIGGGVPLLELRPFKKKKVGIVTTGNEVYGGLIQDAFTPVLRDKLSEYGAEVLDSVILPDDPAGITSAILSMLNRGADMVLCTGGMSVDPDDRTPLAIRNTGARVVGYGAPVLPGAMFMLAYTDEGVPIMGLPGCVMYSGRTVFDLALARAMADVPISAEDMAELGYGGLCLNCEKCTYPNCGFGKF